MRIHRYSVKMYSLLIFTLLGVRICVSARNVNLEANSFPVFPEELDDSFLLSRIIGGETAKYGQFPWQVYTIFYRNSSRYLCGGALIDKQWVLTAAHCVVNASNFTVSVGSITRHSEELGRVTIYTAKAIAHEKYNSRNLNNDIGLIDLGIEIGTNEQIETIRLPKKGDYVEGGQLVEVSGFGRTADDSSSSQMLYYVDLMTITNDQCQLTYGSNVVISSTICAVGRTSKNSCNGDSGGALIIRDEQGTATHVGIVSFSNSRGCSGYPSGYVRTASYLEWIHEKTGISID